MLVWPPHGRTPRLGTSRTCHSHMNKHAGSPLRHGVHIHACKSRTSCTPRTHAYTHAQARTGMCIRTRKDPHACTARYGMAWHGMARHGMAWHRTTPHDTARHDTARHRTPPHAHWRDGLLVLPKHICLGIVMLPLPKKSTHIRKRADVRACAEREREREREAHALHAHTARTGVRTAPPRTAHKCARHGTARHGTARHGTAPHAARAAQHGTAHTRAPHARTARANHTQACARARARALTHTFLYTAAI